MSDRRIKGKCTICKTIWIGLRKLAGAKCPEHTHWPLVRTAFPCGMTPTGYTVVNIDGNGNYKR